MSQTPWPAKYWKSRTYNGHNQTDEKLILLSPFCDSNQLLKEEGKGEHQFPCSLLYSLSSAIWVSKVLQREAVFLCQSDFDGLIFHEIICLIFELAYPSTVQNTLR